MSDPGGQLGAQSGSDPGAERPRLLMVSIVPPWPMDQGNRAVTGKLIQRMIAQGFGVDLLLQGGLDPVATQESFGPHLRVICVAPPPSPIGAQERDIRSATMAFCRQAAGQGSMPEMVARDLFNAANHFHPFQSLSAQMSEGLSLLLERTVYRAVLCNYAVSLGAVVTVRQQGKAMPRVVVITHDALSRLDDQAWVLGADTQARACSAPLEAAVLNQADVVVAISSTERRYFQSIGVSAPVIVCEYDALDEMASWRVEDSAFENRCLIFTGSRNPLNRAGLERFLANCWPMLRLAEPSLRLVVAGSVCEHLSTFAPAQLEGVSLLGVVDRDALKTALQQASVAINPSVWGTGLKIKTVEALCLGLPSVVSSNAAEGLEEFENNGFLIADTPASMVSKVLRLVQQKVVWEHHHQTALAGASERFTAASVYHALEEALSFRGGIS